MLCEQLIELAQVRGAGGGALDQARSQGPEVASQLLRDALIKYLATLK